MSFTPGELKDIFRSEVDDKEGGNAGEDFLWSDEDVFRYMHRAQRQFVRDTRILRKTAPFTPALTELAFTASGATGFLTVDSRITRITRARMATSAAANADPLEIANAEDLDDGFFVNDYHSIFVGDWENKTGPARFLIANLQENQVRLVPIPTIDDTVRLTVMHLPLQTVSCDTAALEVTEEEDQQTMLLWMQHLAYLKQDADTYDKDLSEKFKAEFKEGTETRQREVFRQRIRRTPARYGGIPF